MFTRKDKAILQDAHWSLFSSLEGIFRVIQLYVYKGIGAMGQGTPFAYLAALFVGVVQTIISGLLILRSGYEFFPRNRSRAIVGSFTVGLLSAYIIILPILVYGYSAAPFVIFALMTVLSFIPGEIFNKVSARGRLGVPQIMGLGFVVVGVYAFLGYPMAGLEWSTVPIWTYVALTWPLAMLIHEVIVRTNSTTSPVSPWVHNFWMGISTVAASAAFLIGFMAIGTISLATLFDVNTELLLAFIGLGVLMILIAFSHQRMFTMVGGVFAVKKTAMLSIMLLAAFAIQVLVFGNSIAMENIVAAAAFLIGYLTIAEYPFKSIVGGN